MYVSNSARDANGSLFPDRRCSTRPLTRLSSGRQSLRSWTRKVVSGRRRVGVPGGLVSLMGTTLRDPATPNPERVIEFLHNLRYAARSERRRR
jgi:hypothetical protein